MRPIKELRDKLQKEHDNATTMEDTRSDSYNIEMKFSNLAALELAEQKNFLVEILGYIEGGDDYLEGIIGIVDVIQDDLTDAYGFPEEIVFPFNSMAGYEACTPEEGEVINYKRAFRTLLKMLPLEDLPKYLNKDPDLDTLLKRFFDKGDVL